MGQGLGNIRNIYPINQYFAVSNFSRYPWCKHCQWHSDFSSLKGSLTWRQGCARSTQLYVIIAHLTKPTLSICASPVPSVSSRTSSPLPPKKVKYFVQRRAVHSETILGSQQNKQTNFPLLIILVQRNESKLVSFVGTCWCTWWLIRRRRELCMYHNTNLITWKERPDPHTFMTTSQSLKSYGGLSPRWSMVACTAVNFSRLVYAFELMETVVARECFEVVGISSYVWLQCQWFVPYVCSSQTV